MLNIVIVDADRNFLDHVYVVYTSNPQYAIFTVCSEKDVVANFVHEADIDFFFVDASLLSSENLLITIKEHWPKTNIVLMFQNNAESIKLKWFNYDINGYMVKTSLRSMFDECIQAILKGHCFLNFDTNKKLLFKKFNYKQIQDNLSLLSEREREIFELLIQGYSNKLISEKLWISPFTVNQHLKTIYKKLNVSSRIELIRLT